MRPLADNEHLFTSESVTEGHPDKMADQISDAILDAALTQDPSSRVACETLITTGLVVVAGEITTLTYVHEPDIVRGTITSIGYTDANFGLDAQTCAVLSTPMPRKSTLPAAALVRFDTLNSVPLLMVPFTSTA